MIEFNLFKDGKKNAVTMSFDDNSIHDKRLISIFNKYGIKGTFHLNSESLKWTYKDNYNEVSSIYSGHEISCHGVVHHTLDTLPSESLYLEIYENRKDLEEIAGYPVTGLSYAFGRSNDKIISSLKNMGICYSRTCNETGGFAVPSDFMQWNPTCHYKKADYPVERFLKTLDGKLGFPHLLYIWGHSHEIEYSNEWDKIESICEKLSNNSNIWYATNMEIYRYLTAQRSLVISANQKSVFNPSSETVWFSVGDKKYSIKSGELLKID